jgi:small conductance mechanosensitive channel
MPSNLEQFWLKYADAISDSAINFVAALAILIGGIWLSGAIAKWVKRLSRKNPRIDDTLAAFFASIVRWGLLAFVLIAVLDRFGVQTTQIIAVLGAATLAIGLALQGTLSNVAAGVMLILFRPYKLGDFVEIGGQKGMVQDVNIFTTELTTLNNVKIVLPNAQCWGAPIINFTAHPTRRLDLEFSVAYDTDLNAALQVIADAIGKDPRVHKSPPPLVKVNTLGDFAVTIMAQAWCATGDLMPLRFDLTKAVKEALDHAGIAIPFPTQVALHYEMGGPPGKASPKKD